MKSNHSVAEGKFAFGLAFLSMGVTTIIQPTLAPDHFCIGRQCVHGDVFFIGGVAQ